MEIKKIYIPQSTAIDTSELWGGINDNVLAAKINELIDIVNKQQDIIRQIGEWGSKKGECLWCDTLTEFNPEKPTISKKEKVETAADVQDHKIRSTNERLRKALDTATKCINWIIDTYKTGQDQEADILGICELTAEQIESITKAKEQQ